MGMPPFSDFNSKLEELKIQCNNAERTVEQSSRDIPQKGIKKLFYRTSIKSMTKLGKDVGKIGSVLQQYSAIEKKLPIFNEDEVRALADDLKKLSESVKALTETQTAVSKKAQKAFSSIIFTKAGRELRQAKTLARNAEVEFVNQLRNPTDRFLQNEISQLKTTFNGLILGKTHPNRLTAEKALKELDQAIAQKQEFEKVLDKLDQAKKCVKWADASDCQILTDRYKNLCFQAKNDDKKLYYFENSFWEKYDSPELAQFAKKVTSSETIYVPYSPEETSVGQECAKLLKALKLPGSDGDLLIPFLRFLVLKSENHELLTEEFLSKVKKAVEKVDDELDELKNPTQGEKKSYLETAQTFLHSYLMVLQCIKEEMHQDIAAQLARVNEIQTSSSDTMQAFKTLYDAKIEVPGHIAQFDDAYRNMFENSRLLPLVKEFKKITTCQGDDLLAIFRSYDFKDAMITFFRECNPSAKKDLVTRDIEMEAGDFVKLWKLLILKADDKEITSQALVDSLECIRDKATASRSDSDQRIGALLDPLIGVIESIREELGAV